MRFFLLWAVIEEYIILCFLCVISLSNVRWCSSRGTMKRLGCTIWQPSKKLTISHKNLYFPTSVNSCLLSYWIPFILYVTIWVVSNDDTISFQFNSGRSFIFLFADVAGLGQVQLKLGELKGSVSNFEKVLEVYPDNCETLKVILFLYLSSFIFSFEMLHVQISFPSLGSWTFIHSAWKNW